VNVDEALGIVQAPASLQGQVAMAAHVLAAEVRRLRIELDWRQGDTDTERARRGRDREQVTDVVAAWRELVALNPDARTLGGPASRKVWDALDELAGEVGS
jgi:hypothetical protein